jgi:hypothetical protein
MRCPQLWPAAAAFEGVGVAGNPGRVLANRLVPVLYVT